MCIPPAPPNSINERGEITEAVLAAVWNEQFPLRGPMWDCEGNPVAVIYRGRWTAGSGPDFEGAMLSMGEDPSRLVTGSVEIHLRCADWYAHGHDKDPRYNSVILHVVMWPLAALPITRADGVAVPTLVLADYVTLPAPELIERVSPLLPNLGTLSEEPCWQRNRNRPIEWLLDRIDAAGDDRLLARAAAMEAALDECRSPDQVFYRGVTDSLGYSGNREPMRALSSALPVDNLLALPLGEGFEERATLFESVLLGAAGFLPSQRPESGPLDYTSAQYAEEVEAIWQANAHSAGLDYEPVVSGWSVDRVRPANSPPRRLAAAARLLARLLWEPGGMLGPFTGSPEAEKPQALVKKWTALLSVPGQGYWARYADFGRPLASSPNRTPGEAALVGGSRAGDMLVNIVLPLLVAYAERNDLPEVREAAVQVYEIHPRLAENRITRAVAEEALGPRKDGAIKGARRQQGLIHIYRLYCEARLCYECPLSGLARARI